MTNWHLPLRQWILSDRMQRTVRAQNGLLEGATTVIRTSTKQIRSLIKSHICMACRRNFPRGTASQRAEIETIRVLDVGAKVATQFWTSLLSWRNVALRTDKFCKDSRIRYQESNRTLRVTTLRVFSSSKREIQNLSRRGTRHWLVSPCSHPLWWSHVTTSSQALAWLISPN